MLYFGFKCNLILNQNCRSISFATYGTNYMYKIMNDSNRTLRRVTIYIFVLISARWLCESCYGVQKMHVEGTRVYVIKNLPQNSIYFLKISSLIQLPDYKIKQTCEKTCVVYLQSHNVADCLLHCHFLRLTASALLK